MDENFWTGFGIGLLTYPGLGLLCGVLVWLVIRRDARKYPHQIAGRENGHPVDEPRGINGERFRRPRKYVGAYGVITTSYSRN